MSNVADDVLRMLYVNGQTYRQIEEKTGVSRSTAQRRLKRLGVQKPDIKNIRDKAGRYNETVVLGSPCNQENR